MINANIILLRRYGIINYIRRGGLTMFDNLSISNMLNSIIPISRFNKGEAGKIFDEVNESGLKIVIKNNKPTCILITPEKYEEMAETIENYYLFIEAEKRMKSTKEADFISQEEIMEEFNIKEDDLNDIEVEIE